MYVVDTNYAMQIIRIPHVKSLPRWSFNAAAARYEESIEIRTLTHDLNDTETEAWHQTPDSDTLCAL